jgi:cell wall-associated NlpC family hydrolase
MTESVNSGDLLGSGLGRVALAIVILAAVALALPFGLATIGFSAILGVAGGLEAPSAEIVRGQPSAPSSGLKAPVPAPQSPVTDSTLPYASELLGLARSWLGTRYVFGGCSPSGIDCSCFVQTIFKSIGVRLPRTSQLQYNATVGQGFGTISPGPGDLVFFFRTYFDAGQDWTHVGVVSRVDSNGTVWMIDAPGARAAGDPPDAPFGQVREEPIAGSWLQHRPTYARVPSG